MRGLAVKGPAVEQRFAGWRLGQGVDEKSSAVDSLVGNGLAVGESIVKNQWEKLVCRGVQDRRCERTGCE